MPDARPSEIRWVFSDDFSRDPQSDLADPILRILLTSDGTITTALKALLLAPIDLEVIRQEKIRIDPDTARFLSVESGLHGLARDVWLTAKGERLVCASSIIRLDGLGEPVFQALHQSQKPLGQLLNESGQSITRDRLQIAWIPYRSDQNALYFSTPGPVWARRYRLSLGDEPTAFIQEIFRRDLSDLVLHPTTNSAIRIREKRFLQE